MDTRLLDILVCPLCKGPLKYDKDAQELICAPDRLAYPIRDGIPIMWAEEARDMNAASGTPADGAGAASGNAAGPAT